MRWAGQFFIGGAFVKPLGSGVIDVVDPATEEVVVQCALGSDADVDRAVAAARVAFPSFAATSAGERIALLQRILETFPRHADALAATISSEMGAPLAFARDVQVEMARQHFGNAAKVLFDYPFEVRHGTTTVVREPIGVCGFITAWNWPLMLVASKLAYALAAGCTVVLKPSEVAPLSNLLLAEMLAEAGVPPGVFNLVNGDGPTVGQAIAAHPGIEMISFTGSTRAGIEIARTAAATVKRVHQELGGKSANIILPDADFSSAVPAGVLRSFMNSGQACVAPTRMLVPRDRIAETKALARDAAEAIVVGDPRDPATQLGPLVSAAQYERVQAYIEAGLAEGATLVAGGLGRPSGVNRGYYVRPTVFADVTPQMRIATEEIFGPVLSILSYDSEEEAIAMANDTVYGLAAYVHSPDLDRARRVARRMRAGRAYINLAPSDTVSPFGGYKQSGNGRENGVHGLEEFLEIKAVLGDAA